MPQSLVEGIQRTQQLSVQLKTCELRNSILAEILVHGISCDLTCLLSMWTSTQSADKASHKGYGGPFDPLVG